MHAKDIENMEETKKCKVTLYCMIKGKLIVYQQYCIQYTCNTVLKNILKECSF